MKLPRKEMFNRQKNPSRAREVWIFFSEVQMQLFAPDVKECPSESQISQMERQMRRTFTNKIPIVGDNGPGEALAIEPARGRLQMDEQAR